MTAVRDTMIKRVISSHHHINATRIHAEYSSRRGTDVVIAQPRQICHCLLGFFPSSLKRFNVSVIIIAVWYIGFHLPWCVTIFAVECLQKLVMSACTLIAYGMVYLVSSEINVDMEILCIAILVIFTASGTIKTKSIHY